MEENLVVQKWKRRFCTQKKLLSCEDVIKTFEQMDG